MKFSEQVLCFVGLWLARKESSSTKYFTEKIVQESLMFACFYIHLGGHGESFETTNMQDSEC